MIVLSEVRDTSSTSNNIWFFASFTGFVFVWLGGVAPALKHFIISSMLSFFTASIKLSFNCCRVVIFFWTTLSGILDSESIATATTSVALDTSLPLSTFVAPSSTIFEKILVSVNFLQNETCLFTHFIPFDLSIFFELSLAFDLSNDGFLRRIDLIFGFWLFECSKICFDKDFRHSISCSPNELSFGVFAGKLFLDCADWWRDDKLEIAGLLAYCCDTFSASVGNVDDILEAEYLALFDIFRRITSLIVSLPFSSSVSLFFRWICFALKSSLPCACEEPPAQPSILEIPFHAPVSVQSILLSCIELSLWLLGFLKNILSFVASLRILTVLYFSFSWMCVDISTFVSLPLETIAHAITAVSSIICGSCECSKGLIDVMTHRSLRSHP